ncbi:MAG TPA: prephenate dehydratase [Acidimicrobiales bacterium]|jgi:prephenate dehydratase|nr:prephenate dehydratase [Acidimicrobiales bacterium]
MARIAFLGPPGTFTEEALLTQPDLAGAELVALRTMPDVLNATEQGEVDLGFVAVENSIDGTVNESIDGLIFENRLFMQREVVIAIRLNLLVVPGTALADVKRVVSFPKAIAQCRGFLARELPGAEVAAATSTSEAVRIVGEERPPGTAAVGTALAAKLYGLDVAVADIEDHPENSTRFVLLAADGIPAATGHDKTSIVCFQHADKPGSLHAILGQFSARNINLTKLESRPTKRRLGHYCFLIDLDGHVDDEVVADCLRDLHAQLADVKFLGSYPAAGEHGPARRRDAEASWRAADEWVADLRGRIGR